MMAAKEKLAAPRRTVSSLCESAQTVGTSGWSGPVRRQPNHDRAKRSAGRSTARSFGWMRGATADAGLATSNATLW
jgi:hypothetical protein